MKYRTVRRFASKHQVRKPRMLYTHSCRFKSGARGWYREPTKLLRPSSFIGSRLTNRNRFPSDFDLSVVPVFRTGGTLNSQGNVGPSWKSNSSTVSCAMRELFSCWVGMNRCSAMGVLMVLKYPQCKNHSLRPFQEFGDQRLRQKFLRCSLTPRTRPRPHDA